jgi:hypothetical protein
MSTVAGTASTELPKNQGLESEITGSGHFGAALRTMLDQCELP